MADVPALKRIESNGPGGQGLEVWPAMDPANLVSGNPVQKGYLCDEHEGEGYSVGVWECTAFDDKPGPYPVDEFMLLLEGRVDMALPDGAVVTVNQGEAFILPKGLDCQWKMPGTVRKIFMILDGRAPGIACNPSLSRVTVPPLATPETLPAGAVSSQVTHFLNHDARMRVYTERFGAALEGPAPATDRMIVHVIAGRVAFSDDPGEKFAAGDSFYLHPGHGLNWAIDADTRLLVSCCAPAAP